jgi:hypothetical protein
MMLSRLQMLYSVEWNDMIMNGSWIFGRKGPCLIQLYNFLICVGETEKTHENAQSAALPGFEWCASQVHGSIEKI